MMKRRHEVGRNPEGVKWDSGCGYDQDTLYLCVKPSKNKLNISFYKRQETWKVETNYFLEDYGKKSDRGLYYLTCK